MRHVLAVLLAAVLAAWGSIGFLVIGVWELSALSASLLMAAVTYWLAYDHSKDEL